MLTVTPDQYIFPPRSQDAIPRADTEVFKALDWIAQLKYNDSHALIKYCADGEIQLWNRHAERFRTYYPPAELIEELRMIGDRLGVEPGAVTILDGGLLDQKHQAIKDTIVLWDILVHNNQHLLGTTLDSRYVQLFAAATTDPWIYEHPKHAPQEFGLKFTPNVFIPRNWEPCMWDHMWELVATVNAPFTHGTPKDTNYEIKPVLEGLVFKDPLGVLEMGFKEKNNDSWMMRSRVPTGRHAF
jgi:hypothetical protein